MVEALLDSGAIGLVISLEFTRKQGFKLKKIENPIYQEYRERMEIDVIGGQKWNVILGMLWLAHHNAEIDWRTREVKMMRCLGEYGKQWRPKQEKLGWQKQKQKKKKEKEEQK